MIGGAISSRLATARSSSRGRATCWRRRGTSFSTPFALASATTPTTIGGAATERLQASRAARNSSPPHGSCRSSDEGEMPRRRRTAPSSSRSSPLRSSFLRERHGIDPPLAEIKREQIEPLRRPLEEVFSESRYPVSAAYRAHGYA